VCQQPLVGQALCRAISRASTTRRLVIVPNIDQPTTIRVSP
jgi:hypothetical protein